MSLDVFAGSITAADQNVMRNAAPDLPAEFEESASMAWRSMTEWHNSTAGELSRNNALVDYIDHVKQKTGEQLPMPGFAPIGDGSEFVSLDDFNAAQAKINEKNPTAMLRPLSDQDVGAMATRRLRATHQEIEDFSRREGTWGGTAGTIVGTLGGALADPIAIATLPLGGAGEAGIALRALEFAAISGGTEALTAAATYKARVAAVPDVAKEIPGEIASATLFGAALGAGFGALGKLLGHGAKPLPTSIRDEVNAATSEAQFHVSNPFPTAAGESAARDAHVDATNALLRGDAVTAGERFDAAHVADYAIAAKADTPEAFALAGERHLRPETFGDVPDVERFDVMPGAADDVASYWEARIADASPQERVALGATDADVPAGASPVLVVARRMPDGSVRYGKPGDIHVDLIDADHFETHVAPPPVDSMGFAEPGGAFMSRDEATAFLDREHPDISARIDGVRDGGKRQIEASQFNRATDTVKEPSPVAARDLSQAEMQKLAADPATESSVLHNLEHIAEANPDMEFTTQIRRPDGTYQFTTQKLSDVMADLSGWETAAREIEACAVGGALEAAE